MSSKARYMRALTVCLLAAVTVFAVGVSSAGTIPQVSVRDFGARGNGSADDTAAFKKALASGSKCIYAPAGRYVVGSEKLVVPDGTRLFGDGDSTVLMLSKDAGMILSLSKGSRLDHMQIVGTAGRKGGLSDSLVFVPNGASGVTIDSVGFRDCRQTCVATDHADDFLVQHCDFRDVTWAMLIQFSSRVRVLNNTVIDASIHGIQFWGNWKWDSKGSSDIIITGNYVKNGGGGAIWGAGATRVIASNNIVDGATDVGIDLEWCDDSVITGNTVRNCENGCISLFFSCKRVSITGNTVNNDRKIPDTKGGWYARAGIWLTYPNTKEFGGDMGHRDITISGNTIYCAEGERRAMWIASGADNITITGNTVRGGEIWAGGGEGEPLRKITDNTIVRIAKP